MYLIIHKSKTINNVRLACTKREVGVELCTKTICPYHKIYGQIVNKPPLHTTQFKPNQNCYTKLKCTYSQPIKVTQTTQ